MYVNFLLDKVFWVISHTHLFVGLALREPGRLQGATSSLLLAAESSWGGAKPGAASLPPSSVTTRPGCSRPRAKYREEELIKAIFYIITSL